MDFECVVCMTRERCAMSAAIPAQGCGECGVQICGVCVDMCRGSCPVCRDPNFGNPVSFQKLVLLWDGKDFRSEARDLTWVAVEIGDAFVDMGESEKAIKYYSSAFDLGSPVAAGRLYPFLSGKKRIKLLKQYALSSKGRPASPVAQYNLAVAYSHVGNFSAAFRFFSFAARGGHAYAAYHLACGYEQKHGRNQKVPLGDIAAKWFRVAALAGFGCASYRLGIAAAKSGNLPEFYNNMDAAMSRGYEKASQAIRLMLNDGVSRGFSPPPDALHCRVCKTTVSLQACCANCNNVHCSPRCRARDAIYGTLRAECPSVSHKWLGFFLSEIFI